MLDLIIRRKINEVIAPVFNDSFKTKLLESDFELVDVKDTLEGNGNTTATLKIVDPASGYKGERKITYDRLDATELFYGVNKKLPLAASEIDEYSVIGAINAKYGLMLTIDDITKVEIVDDKAVVTFAPTSPMIKGVLSLTYFSEAEDLGTVLFRNDLGEIRMQEATDLPNITYHTYALDLSYAKYTVDRASTGDDIPAEVVKALAAATGEPWAIVPNKVTEFNCAGAKLVFHGTTLEADRAGHPCNRKFNNVAIYRLTNFCNNYSGLLLVNMN
ncbi:hypothetical protein [Proteus mirabilis]|uniref:DUF7941 domain-family protein n=1 Tax=Proteus mirabilis TaxID=584 RepID=UPI0034D67D2D